MPRAPKYIPLIALLAAALVAGAQQPIATVSTADASVSGVLETVGGSAAILTNGTITAHDHTAVVALPRRKGSLHVCQTSVVHVTASKGDPLLIGLDRGALEISLPATSFDAVLTPDMRLQPASAGPLDLRIRVVSNGDTCVENRGSAAPALMVSDSFGESSYIVHAQQHVLFEHGSLRQVVDSERSPCGCPPPLAVSVAESGATGPRTARPGEPVAEAHPFPEAVSQGLAPAPAPPQLPPGKTHTQVDLTLTYDSNHPPPAAAHPGEQSPAPDSPVVAQAPTPEPQSPDVVHLVVRFCRWIFRR